MVLAQREKVLLIDLSKFIYMLSKGLLLVQAAIRLRQPVWFVTLDTMKASTVQQAALACGEFYVGTNWINGLITNFLEITSTSWVRYHYRAHLVHSAKQRLRQDIYNNWLLTRLTWPRVVFLCGVNYSYRVAKETLSSAIACVGIADTATSAHALSCAIPGNDESLESIYFYNTLLANSILLKKFSLVFNWAVSLRRTSRLASFTQWFAFYGASRLKLKQQNISPIAPWHSYTFISSGQSSFITTASLMSNLIYYTMGIPKNIPKAGAFFYTVEGGLNFTAKEVHTFFLTNDKIFRGLLGIHFMASRRNFLKPWLKQSFNPINAKRINRFSYLKTNFSFRHNFLDLMTAKDAYIYKKAVTFPAFLNYENRPLERVCFKILSSLFLLLASFQLAILHSPAAAVNPRAYAQTTSYFRRLGGSPSIVPDFFREKIYLFLVKALGLTSFVTKKYSLLDNIPRRSLVKSPNADYFVKYLANNSISKHCISLKKQFALQKLITSKGTKVSFLAKTHLSPRAFTSFTLDNWAFTQGFLPRIYWQFNLTHYSSRNKSLIAFESNLFQRNFRQERLASYPIFNKSILWIRKNK
jgi:small subunit ribosomal protein S2